MGSVYRLEIQVAADGAVGALNNLQSVIAKLDGDMSAASKAFDEAEKGIEQTRKAAQKAAQETQNLGKKTKKAGDDIGRAGKDAKKAKGDFEGLHGAFSRLKGLMLGGLAFVGLSAGLSSVLGTADAMKNLDSQIKIATGSAEKHAHAMSEIERIAMANQVSLDSVGSMYVSNERALKQLGKSQDEVLKFTENVTTAMRTGGASAGEQAAALTQLGQAMASGVLRGDEFNSIAEQSPVIMELLSDSLKVSTGELRKMASQGKLTADVVYDALTSASATDKLADKAATTGTTIQGALQNVSTQWDLAVHGLMNSQGGISSVIADGIGLVADGVAAFGNYIPMINGYITEAIADVKGLWTAFGESSEGQAVISGVKTAFEGLKTAISGVVEFTAEIGAFFRDNPELAIALASGITAAATAFGIYKGVLWAVTTATTAWTAVTGAAAAVFAFITSPIGLAVAAIGLLVAGGVYLYRNWDMVKAKATEVWESVKQYVSDAWEGIKSFFTDGETFSNIWNSVKEAAGTAWEGVKAAVQTAWEGIKAFFTGGDLLASTWEDIKNGVATAWQTIKQAVIDKFNEIKQAFNDWLGGQSAPVQEMVDNILVIFEGLVGGIGAIFGGLVSVGGAAWEGIKGAASGAAEFIGNVWGKAKDGASKAWEAVKETASMAFDGVKSIASSAANKLSTAWDKTKEGASKAFSEVRQAVTDKLDEAKVTAQAKINDIKAFIENSGIGELVGKVFTAATNVIQTAINGWKTIITAGVSVIKVVLGTYLSAFAVIFNTVFNTVKTVVQTAFGVIKGIVTGDLGAVKAAISNGLFALAGIARNALSQMLGVFKNAGSQLRIIGGEVIQGLINGIKAKMEQAVAALRETASNMIGAAKSVLRINSPSKVTHEIGEWVSQGLANGINADAQKAIDAAANTANKVVQATTSAVGKSAKEIEKERKKAEKERQKQAEKEKKSAVKQLEDYKKAVSDAQKSLERENFILQQKAIGNPYAEITADIKFGKYGKEDATKLQALTQQNAALESQLKMVDELRDLKRQIAEASFDEVEFLQWRFENTQDFLGITEQAFNEYKKGVTTAKDHLRVIEMQKDLNAQIHKLDEDILLAGKNELQVLQWQLEHAEKYKGVSDDIKQGYYERVKALKQENELTKSRQAFERAKAVAKNPDDKYAGRRFDLQQQGLDGAAIDGIISNERNTDAISAYQNMLSQQAQDTDPHAKLKQQYEERLAIIKGAQQAEILQDSEFKEQMRLADEAFAAAKTDLQLATAEQGLGLVSGLMKDILGEESRGYKAIFALEKGMAVARILLANKESLAKAWASAPFPYNLPAVGKVLLESGALVSAVNAVRPVIGQAHDGIMSVPKSGTWNLEKGERVLPKHTAKALDKRLDGMEGGNNIAITINIDNNGNSQTSAQNANAMSRQMADGVEAVVLKVLRRETMQGGMLRG